MGILGMARNFYGLMKRSIDSTKVVHNKKIMFGSSASGTNWKEEKLRLEKSSHETRQANYFCGDKFVPITEIPSWSKYFQNNKNPFQKRCQKKILRHLKQNILNLL